MTCTFFGHRDTENEIEPILRKVIIDLIENKNICNFYVGNHGRYDSMVRKLLIELKEIYPIRYAVVLAYLPSNKCEFEKYSADDTMLPEGIEKVPQKFAINYRNKWMIEHSDCVVTYVKHNLGGAARFKEYAIKKNKIVIDLVEKSLP